MLPDPIFDRFAKDSPIAVMVRGLLEHALPPQSVDQLFQQHAQTQYTRELLFSPMVDLMALVVCGVRPSIHAAYQARRDSILVSTTAVYDKLQRVEPHVAATLVRQTAGQLASVIAALGGALPEPLPGYHLRILDGNCLAATEHRLHELRVTAAGPLPGKSLVVLDPATMLAIDIVPCEDGHTQERALLHQVLPTVAPGELWLADRNFCTLPFVLGVQQQGAAFLVRQHANLPWQPVTNMTAVGQIDGVSVSEQTVRVHEPDSGEVLLLRRLRLLLPQPTRDGETVIYLLTNVPASAATALVLAQLYRRRWSIEGLFQDLAATLDSEQPRLGYPKAALFAFCVSLVAYNVLAVVRAALRAVHGQTAVEEGVSTYYLADEIEGVYRGMMIAVPAEHWRVFGDMSAAMLAKALRQLAHQADLALYQRHPRGSKKPRPKRAKDKRHPHVATARLIADRSKPKLTP